MLQKRNRNIVRVLIHRYTPKDERLNKEVPDSQKQAKVIPKWTQHIKDASDFDLFKPSKIEDLDLKDTKNFQIIYLQMSKSEEKLQLLQQKGQIFFDEKFQANDKSLYGPYDQNPNWSIIKWKKLSDYFPSGIIFRKTQVASPRDIRQGFLGDCYFLAGLAALAENPQRITELFLLEEINQQRYFSVKILFCGKWIKVDLDEMIPFLFDSPAFSASVDQGLWVIILEKAWAKIYHSYKQIEAGFAEQVLHDLSGAPVFQLFFHSRNYDKERGWHYLSKSCKNNYAMVCCSNPGNDTTKSALNIIQGHAYTLLNCSNIRIGDSEEKIIKLRNPWGKGQFTGKWSDYDDIWDQVSEEEKKNVQYEPQIDDGTFFISYPDLLKEFSYVDIAEIVQNASYVYESYYDPENKGVYFTLRILYQGVYSLQVDKTPQRSFTGDKQLQYKYPNAQLTLKQLQDQNEQKLIQDVFTLKSKKRTLCKKLELNPGKYVAFVRIDWDPTFQRKFIVNLASYSEQFCGIYIASTADVIDFTGSSQQVWLGQFYKYVFKPRLQEQLLNKNNNKKQVVELIKKINDTDSQDETDKNIRKDRDQSNKKFINILNDLNKRKKRKQQERKKKEEQIKIQRDKQRLRQEEKKKQSKKRQEQERKQLIIQKQKKKRQMEEKQKNKEKEKEKEKKREIEEKQKNKEKEQRKEDNSDINSQKKKVIRKRETTNFKSTKIIRIPDSQSGFSNTVEKTVEDHEQRIFTQYKDRKNLKLRIQQNKTKKQAEEILTNGELVHQRTVTSYKNVESREMKDGKIKKTIKQYEKVEQSVDDDELSQFKQIDNLSGLQKGQIYKEELDVFTKGLEEEQKQSLIYQAENTDVINPYNNQEPKMQLNNDRKQKLAQFIKSNRKKETTDEINKKQAIKLFGKQAQSEIISSLMKSKQFKQGNILRYPSCDCD